MLPTRPADPRHDSSLDHYARLVRQLLDVPVALVTLVREHDQLFLGAEGLDEPWASSRRTPLSHSFCQYVVASGSPMVVNDARRDLRLAAHPGLTEMGVVAYAGWPIHDALGLAIGAICAIDHAPRAWTTHDVDVLEDLAHRCAAELRPGAAIRRPELHGA